jgi:hypothetical protein
MRAVLRLSFLLIALSAISQPTVLAQTCNYDEICQSHLGENTSNCCNDCCAAVCGDSICESPYEDEHICPQDCIGEVCDWDCSENFECSYCWGSGYVCINSWCENCDLVICDDASDCWWCWGAGAGCTGGMCNPNG